MTDAARRARGDVVVDASASVRLDGAGLEAQVAALAGGLRSAGVRRGDVVAWQAPNWHEVIVLYRACWRLGAIAGPIHHQAGPADVDAMLGVLAPTVWLPPNEVRGSNARLPRLLGAGTPVTRSAARPTDLATVLFTSGSTGGPKAALHTQRGLAYKARVMADAHQLHDADSVLMPAPLAHVSGLLNAVLVPGVVPMATHLMAKWDPDDAVSTIERERITFMIGPPTFFVALMSAPAFSTERVASLRLVSSGGAGVTPAFIDEASARLACRVKRTYGSTEAPTITTSTPDDPYERARETDGRATGAARLRVSDPATGRELEPGDVGELWLRGPELFVGYADAGADPCRDHTRLVPAPAISPRSMATVGSRSSGASRTSSSEAARTSPPPRSKPCSRRIPRSATRWPSATPTSVSASASVPSSSRRPRSMSNVPRLVRAAGHRSLQDTRAGRAPRRRAGARGRQAGPRGAASSRRALILT